MLQWLGLGIFRGGISKIIDEGEVRRALLSHNFSFIPSMALSRDAPDYIMTQFFTPKIGSCCGKDS